MVNCDACTCLQSSMHMDVGISWNTYLVNVLTPYSDDVTGSGAFKGCSITRRVQKLTPAQRGL